MIKNHKKGPSGYQYNYFFNSTPSHEWIFIIMDQSESSVNQRAFRLRLSL